MNVASRNLIENVTWKLGGHNISSATVETLYKAERGIVADPLGLTDISV